MVRRVCFVATAQVCAPWRAGMLLVGLTACFFDWGTDIVDWMGKYYLGFKPTVLGSLIGAVWGFLDAAIGGAIIALVYNAVVGKKPSASAAAAGDWTP